MIMKVCSICYLLNLLLLSQARDPCPGWWRTSDVSGTCWKLYVYGNQRNYLAARKFCKQQGADLLIISSRKMEKHFQGTIHGGFIFIGLNDRKEEGKFTWLDYSEEASYTNFDKGLRGKTDGKYLDCVLWKYAFKEKWRDWNCRKREKFICERLSDCLHGFYGLNCAKKCDLHCSGPDQVCMDTDGRCTRSCGGNREPWCQRECPQGKFGVNCTEYCSIHCLGKSDTCDRVHGECRNGCVGGYKGERCDSECPQGKFGVNCTEYCSIHCLGKSDTCDRVHGECRNGCVGGYKGERCDSECSPGTYGLMCLQTCSQFCHVPGVCNHVDGKCTGPCQPGYQNPQCNEVCDFGMYGENCSEVCSRFCLRGQKPCHHVTGKCAHGCISGYRGEKCIDTCIQGTYGPGCNETCGYCKIERKLCDELDGSCFYGCIDGYNDVTCKTACDKGWFGENCQFQCSQNCLGQNEEEKVCDHKTGTCPKGCIDGFLPPTCKTEFACKIGTYGKNCSQTCSKHCGGSNKPCDANGTCVFNCEPGYLGLKCDVACEHGKFGFNCERSCSQNCAGDGHPCNLQNGKCTHGCKAGFQGPFCETECDEGRYGANCAFKCSRNCKRAKRKCSHKTGTCLAGCVDGYRNAQCHKECLRGTYGHKCSKKCTDKCGKAVNNCDPRDGSCDYGETKEIGCPRGTYGSRCSERCDFCDKGECDPISGICFHAEDLSQTLEGRVITQFPRCGQGKYGENCTLNCSDHCRGPDKACEYKTGHCLDGCEAGYEGDKCDQVSATALSLLGIHMYYLAAMSLASLLIIFCAAIYVGIFEKEEKRIEKTQGVVPEGVRDKNAMMSRVNKEDKVTVPEVNSEDTIDANRASEEFRWYGGKLMNAKMVPEGEAPLNVDERLSPPVGLDKKGYSDSSISFKSYISSSYYSSSTSSAAE